MQKIFIYLFLLSFSTTSWSQFTLQKSKVVMGPGVQPEDIPYLSQGAERILRRYAENADFYDSTNRMLSEQKKEEFVSLFSADAMVVSDYSSLAVEGDGNLTSYLDYLLFIDEKLSETGVPFQLSEPKLEKISYESSLKRFRLELSFSKKIFLSFVPGRGVIELKNGRQFTQKMVLLADKQTLTEPLIVQISATNVEPINPALVAQVKVPAMEEKKSESEQPKKEIDPAIVVNPAQQPTSKVPAAKEVPTAPSPEPPGKPIGSPTKTNQDPVKLGKVMLTTSNATIDNRLSFEEKTNAFNALQDAINQYAQYASLLDPASATVSDSYISNFEKLFGSQAKVYNDLLEVEELELINYSDYISMVYNQLNDVGVRYKVLGARLEKLVPEYDDYYQATIVIDKQMLHFLRQSRDGSLVEVPLEEKSARVYPLRFQYFFKLGYPPKIENIESAIEICVRDKEEQFLSFSARYGLSFFGASVHSGASPFFSAEQLTSESSNVIGLGVQWSSNTFYEERSCKKPLFWTAGIGMYQFSYSTDLRDWSYAYQPYQEDNSYWKETSVRGTLNQVAQIRVLEGRLGLRYRLKSTYNTTVFADMSILPSYLVTSSVRYDKEGGVQSIIFDGIRVIGTDTTRTLDLTANDGTSWLDAHAPNTRFDEKQQVGDVQLPNLEGRKINSTLGLSASLGISVYKRLSYSFGLVAGLDFQYGFRASVQSEKSQIAPFLDKQVVESDQYSLLQSYQDISFHHSVGFRLGLYYKINK